LTVTQSIPPTLNLTLIFWTHKNTPTLLPRQKPAPSYNPTPPERSCLITMRSPAVLVLVGLLASSAMAQTGEGEWQCELGRDLHRLLRVV